MTAQTILGLLAGTLGMAMAIAPLLQAVRVVRRGSADDISRGWLTVIVFGASAWCAYGLSRGDLTITAVNAVGAASSAATLAVVCAVRRRSA